MSSLCNEKNCANSPSIGSLYCKSHQEPVLSQPPAPPGPPPKRVVCEDVVPKNPVRPKPKYKHRKHVKRSISTSGMVFIETTDGKTFHVMRNYFSLAVQPSNVICWGDGEQNIFLEKSYGYDELIVMKRGHPFEDLQEPICSSCSRNRVEGSIYCKKCKEFNDQLDVVSPIPESVAVSPIQPSEQFRLTSWHYDGGQHDFIEINRGEKNSFKIVYDIGIKARLGTGSTVLIYPNGQIFIDSIEVFPYVEPIPATIGDRSNTGKPSISIVLEARHALEGCTRVLEMGAEKYSRGNWRKGLKHSEVADSMIRHLCAYLAGETTDEESGLPHVDHVLCNALFLSELTRTRPDLNDIKNN